jgi:hypothetical protein
VRNPRLSDLVIHGAQVYCWENVIHCDDEMALNRSYAEHALYQLR